MHQDDEKIQLIEELIEEGNKLYADNELNKAEKIYIRAKQLSYECQEWLSYVRICLKLSHLYYANGDVSNEMESYFDGIECASKNHFYDYLATLHLNIGSDYMEVGGNDRALKYFQMAEDFRSRVDEVQDGFDFDLIVNINLCEIYLRKNDIEKAKKHLDLARHYMEFCDDQEDAFSFKTFFYSAKWRMGDRDEVMSEVEVLVEESMQVDFFKNYLESMNDLCTLLCEMEEYDLWKKILLKMNDFTEGKNLKIITFVTEHWLKYFEAINDEDEYKRTCVIYAGLMMQRKKNEDTDKILLLDQKISSKKAEIGKEAIKRQLYYDTLTGIRNRNRMLKDSKRYIEQSAKYKTTITIGLLDIDFFKECNDTYGHIAGDKCLMKIADCIKKCVGSQGHVYRYGGDEFLVLLRGVEKKEIVEDLAKSIHEAVHRLQIPNAHSPKDGIITLSQGYTMAVAEENDTIDVLVNLADKVLYKVKRYGRDDYLFMRMTDILEDTE